MSLDAVEVKPVQCLELVNKTRSRLSVVYAHEHEGKRYITDEIVSFNSNSLLRYENVRILEVKKLKDLEKIIKLKKLHRDAVRILENLATELDR